MADERGGSGGERVRAILCGEVREEEDGLGAGFGVWGFGWEVVSNVAYWCDECGGGHSARGEGSRAHWIRRDMEEYVGLGGEGKKRDAKL